MILSCPKCQTNYTGSCCGDPTQPCPQCGYDEETLYLSSALCMTRNFTGDEITALDSYEAGC